MSLIEPEIIPCPEDKAIKHEYFLTSEIKFDAAHRLSNYEGKCSRLHGHTYRVKIVVKANKLNSWGAAVDFGKLKKLLKEHVDQKYDHKTILWVGDDKNKQLGKIMGEDWITWMNGNPTAENIAKDIWDDLIPALRLKNVKLVEVIVYETATNKATYVET